MSDSDSVSAAPGPTRVIVVDDHPIVCRGIVALLATEPDFTCCGQADNAADAMTLLEQFHPQLAVVDIALKTGSGIEFVKSARAFDPGLTVLMMSMFDESIYAERALRAGASGYVTKQDASENLLTALRTVRAGELYLSVRVKNKLIHRLAAFRPRAPGDSMESLSDREMEVFELIGHGYTTRDIAERLHLSVKTIDSYRENLKVKLNIANAAELLQQAIRWTKTKHLV